MKGLYVVAQTPFDDRGEVDLQSVDTLARFYLKHGANGFTVLGVSGEAGKLNQAEALSVAQRYIAAAEGRDVIVGVSNASLVQLTDLTKAVMDMGAKGVMIAPTSGLKTDEDIGKYFELVFDRLGSAPVVLQDFPFATGVSMSVPLILSLLEKFPQICAIKEEDLPHLNKISKIKSQAKRDVPILTGNNGMYLPLELDRGAAGPMAGFSFPEMLSGVYALHTSGDIAGANDLFDRFLPLLRYEAMGFWGVAARKEVMRRRGALRCATMRAPGPALTVDDLREIDFLLKRMPSFI
jgi:4-hydroxy-tetrahydrodipicolinate synthase